MNKFSERLKELREEQNLSQIQLEKATGLSRTAIYYWETEQREPKLSALFTLADYFKVTLDYLTGRED